MVKKINILKTIGVLKIIYNIIMIKTFEVKNLTSVIDNNEVLKNISFSLKQGDILAILGPNGSGKTSLLKTLFSHFLYKIKSGKIILNKKDITNHSTYEKAKDGMFMCFQNPIELEGVKLTDFYKLISPNKNNFASFFKEMNDELKKVDLNSSFINKDMNYGFSGGEKKKNEIMQLDVIKPQVLLIDEIDSGLDLDAIKTISKIIKKHTPNTITIIISHNIEFLNLIKPNKSIILVNGEVVKSGDSKYIKEVAQKGFSNFKSSKRVEIDCYGKKIK